MSINLDRANTRIVGWANKVKEKLIARMDQLGIRHVSYSQSPKAAAKSLKVRTPKQDGAISRISYTIPRHMIYVHKGVGRGTKISQVGNNSRVAKPWFNPVIDENIDELADTVAEEYGDAIVNNLLIR